MCSIELGSNKLGFLPAIVAAHKKAMHIIMDAADTRYPLTREHLDFSLLHDKDKIANV